MRLNNQCDVKTGETKRPFLLEPKSGRQKVRTREVRGPLGSYLSLDVDGPECRRSEINKQRRCLAGVEPVGIGVQSAVGRVSCAVLDQKLDRFGVGIKS